MKVTCISQLFPQQSTGMSPAPDGGEVGLCISTTQERHQASQKLTWLFVLL